MSSTSETGHAKNLARFGKLINITESMPSSLYNPAKQRLFTGAMREQERMAIDALTGLKKEEDLFNKIRNERADAFEALEPFLPRILSNIVLAETSARDLDNAQSLVARIRGEHRSARQPQKAAGTGTPPVAGAEEEDSYHISVSQQSFDSKIDHFQKLIILINSLPNYATNDGELTKEALQLRLNHLSALNKETDKAGRQLMGARHVRDVTFYSDKTGLLATVKLVKAYLRTLADGTQNAYYTAATRIQFRDLS